MGRAGRSRPNSAGKRRMTSPHTAIVSGGAKAAADLCMGTGPRRARQPHGQLSSGGGGWLGPAGHCWRAAVLAVPGQGQTEQRRNISLALDAGRIGGQTLLQAVAHEQAGGVGAVGPTG